MLEACGCQARPVGPAGAERPSDDVAVARASPWIRASAASHAARQAGEALLYIVLSDRAMGRRVPGHQGEPPARALVALVHLPEQRAKLGPPRRVRLGLVPIGPVRRGPAMSALQPLQPLR